MQYVVTIKINLQLQQLADKSTLHSASLTNNDKSLKSSRFIIVMYLSLGL